MKDDIDHWLEALAGRRESDALIAPLRQSLLSRERRAREAFDDLGFQRLLRRLDRENLLEKKDLLEREDLLDSAAQPQPRGRAAQQDTSRLGQPRELRKTNGVTHTRKTRWFAGMGLAACLVVSLTISLSPDRSRPVMMAESAYSPMPAMAKLSPPESRDFHDTGTAELTDAERVAGIPEPAETPGGGTRVSSAAAPPADEHSEPVSQKAMSAEALMAARTEAERAEPDRRLKTSDCGAAGGIAEIRVTEVSLVEMLDFYRSLNDEGIAFLYLQAEGRTYIHFTDVQRDTLSRLLQQRFDLNCDLHNLHTLKIRFPIADPERQAQ